MICHPKSRPSNQRHRACPAKLLLSCLFARELTFPDAQAAHFQLAPEVRREDIDLSRTVLSFLNRQAILQPSDYSFLWQQGELHEDDGHNGLPQTSEFHLAEPVPHADHQALPSCKQYNIISIKRQLLMTPSIVEYQPMSDSFVGLIPTILQYKQ